MTLKLILSLAARVQHLTNRKLWGESALPPLTMAQAKLLMDALNDTYSVGVLRGQLLERESAERREEEKMAPYDGEPLAGEMMGA